MAYEKKEGDSSIFKNKLKKDNQPDYKGTAFIEGVEYELSYWTKETNAGEKYFSGKIQRKKQN